MRFLLAFLICLTIVSAPALADKRQDNLRNVERELKAQQAQATKLKKKASSIQSKLDALQGDLRRMTHDLQMHEKAVLKLRDDRAATKKDITETREALQSQRLSLAQTIMAMQRLNRVPPQALLLRPSAPIDMARSFSMLQKIIPAVATQADEIKQKFEHLQALQETQKRQETELLASQKKLESRREALTKTVKERQALLAQTQEQQQASDRKARELAGKAKTLHDLLERLSREPSRPAAEVPVYDFRETSHKIARSLSDWFGRVTSHGRLPVAGDVITAYGEALPGGGHSQGLKIRTAPGAVVAAPANGVIRFAGPFRQYKLLVIIQHGKNEHSLLGGLHELYTRTGARVAAGEPLGSLAKLGGDSAAASLYYERRHNGKAVDPRRL